MGHGSGVLFHRSSEQVSINFNVSHAIYHFTNSISMLIVFYMLLLLIGSLWPVPHPKIEPFWKDMLRNLVHVPAYAFLAFLWLKTLRARKLSFQKAAKITILGCFVFGIVIEFLQGFVPGRDPSSLDVLLNTLGILIPIIFFS